MNEENNDPNSSAMFSFNSENEYSVEEMEMILKSSMEDDSTSDQILAKSEKKLVAGSTPMLGPNPVIRKNTVSGSYSVTSGGWKLDLRIDVDGRRPMGKVSGDYYSISGGTTTYFGSFRIDSISLTTTDAVVRITGIANTTWSTAYKNARINIPKTIFVQPRAPATIRWSNSTGQAGAIYVCPFVSIYFRRVLHELDSEIGVTPFTSYNTGSLPSGGPSRVLSISSAYNEAGLDFPQVAGNVISSSETGADAQWTDAELHASMVRHFSIYRDIPQWTVWSIACKSQHILGPNLLGIMFDQQGKQRQGCATFYGGVGGTTSDKLREQLYTHVHELGHCFNLLHSWQKSFANPPAPNRLESLSWMNYPWRFPGGPSVFYNSFPFQFDDLEIVHLRHAFRNNIIMGGNPFIIGSALDSEMTNIHLFEDPVKDESGLELRLTSKKSVYKPGEPVVTEIKLSTTVQKDKLVTKDIHPKLGNVKIGIRKPSGIFVLYESLIDYLKIPETTILNDDNPAVYASAYIGYGKDLYFDQIGEYLIRAIYYSLDGSQVYSNVLSIRVSSPLNQTDEKVANLLMGDQQGKLFYLLGSPSSVLEDGNKAFDIVLNECAEHPLAVYVQFVRGVDAGRKFKIIEKDEVKVIKEREPDKSIKLLNQVVEKSKQGEGLDNISTNYSMREITKQYLLKENTKKAKETMDDMVKFFSDMNLNPNVINTIKKQAKETLHSKKS